MSAEEADKWVAKIKHQSAGVFTSTTTYAAWGHIPSTYVFGPEDKTAFRPHIVNFMLDRARKYHPDTFDVVETCEGGAHSLMITHPVWLADVVRRAAGEKL